MRRIYMDANATTPLLPEVLEAMRPWLTGQFGNASSVHYYGQQARAAVERARESVSRLFQCRPAEVVFTSGGTESDNLALSGVLNPGDHLITTQIEHHAILHAAERFIALGVEVTFLPVGSDGAVRVETVKAAIRPNTKLISVMMANNETGVIQPLVEIGALAKEAGVLFHTDAVQAVGKLTLNVEQLGCHLLSVSGHKFHAPQGTGALFVRRGLQLSPQMMGGGHERGRRAGTENVAGVVGLGRAAEIALEGLHNGALERMAGFRDRLEQGLLEQIPGSGLNGDPGNRVANTSSIWFDDLEGEALVIALDLKGLAVSGGSACQSGAMDPSHVLLAMGQAPARSRASLRFSLMKSTTEEDVDFALEVVPDAVARLRNLVIAG